MIGSKTHQDLINAVYKATEKLRIALWTLLRAAGWVYFVDDRGSLYKGPDIDNIGQLTPEQKAALKMELGLQ